MKQALVIAPHPDDEILGAGATIAKMVAQGTDVSVVIVTKGMEPKFSEEMVRQTRAETKAAHDLIGVEETIYLDLPAAELDSVSEAELGRTISDVVHKINPDILFIPFCGDVHFEHQKVALASMVASRPHRDNFPAKVLAYETLSETNWNAPYLSASFIPNVFVDVSQYLEIKIKAMRCFESQLFEFPHERSLESIEVLARHRGSTVKSRAAEAFVLIRDTSPL